MARRGSKSIVAALGLIVAALVVVMPTAFISAPRTSKMPERAQLELVAGASALTAGLPQSAANAFVFEGEEYFDPWFGIDPFAWAVAAFINISLLNLLRTSVLKYNTPVSKKPLQKKFVNKFEEFAESLGPDAKPLDREPTPLF